MAGTLLLNLVLGPHAGQEGLGGGRGGGGGGGGCGGGPRTW